MIKLVRAACPSYLTDQKVQALTDEYKQTGKSVWNKDEIKSPLLDSSHGKCAYCECSLTKESNYMEVEHFEDKHHNPDKVVLWENLLPACKKCNGSKSTHDVIKYPVVNPYEDDPRDHLAMRLYRMRGKTPRGKTAIDVVRLNHSERLVKCRFDIGEKIAKNLETAWERYKTFRTKQDTRSRNRLIGIVEGMLQECQPQAEYSASTAATLLSNPDYQRLVEAMETDGIWSDELEEYHQVASDLMLDQI
ncbi:MAG: HNH endonuclease [Cyanobacteria bacterium P01_G01_bin.54]